MIDTYTNQQHSHSHSHQREPLLKENGEPHLFVHIPIQWPVRGSVSTSELEKQNRLQSMFDDPNKNVGSSSSASSSISFPSSSTTRPKLTNRSLSNRQYLATKTIAAAVSTQKQNRQRRSRETSNEENSSTSFSSSDEEERISQEEKIVMNLTKPISQTEKFATLPRSQSNSMRKIMERRRHVRSTSVPDAPATSLRIDTFLPLYLPPPNLCAESPSLTIPFSGQAKQDSSEQKENSLKAISSKANHHQSSLIAIPSGQSSSYFGQPRANAELRRSESLTSFVSAQSDGSWHGDQGDNDPDGQLAKALGQQVQDSVEKDHCDIQGLEEQSHHNLQESSHSKDAPQHGHGPLQIATYDYEEEDDHRRICHAEVTSSTKGKSVEANVDKEKDIAKHAGPMIERIAKYLFNLNMFGSDQNDQSSPFESSMSHSQSDSHLFGRLSSPSSLSEEAKVKQNHRSWASHPSRSRAATIAGESDLHVHGEVDKEDVDNASGLWGLWRWIMPDIDAYMGDRSLESDQDSQAMKRNISVPSLVSGTSMNTIDEDEWDEEESESIIKMEPPFTSSHSTSNAGFINLSPPQLCYAESYLRDSGFGLKSFESSAFNEFTTSGEVPTKILSSRNQLPTSIIVRTSEQNSELSNVKPLSKSSDPSPLWDNRLLEEPYERSWGSMLGLSVY